MANIYPDVSEHQGAVLDSSFNRRFVMIRLASEWDRLDKNFRANYNWCLAARAAGKIDNFGLYIIPGFVANNDVLDTLDQQNVVKDCVVMSDEESWGGQVKGDHSASFNSLVEAARARQNGRADLVWSYFNRGDGAALHPTRPAWLDFIIAGYNGNDPRDEYTNCIGWQYTNGIENATSWPTSTPPVGSCDHNVLFIDYPKPGAVQEDGLSAADVAAINAHTDQMFTLLWQAMGGQDNSVFSGGVTAKDAQDHTDQRLDYLYKALAGTPNSVFSGGVTAATLLAQIAGLQSAVSQLGAGGSIDYGKVQEAVKAVLDGAHIEVTP